MTEHEFEEFLTKGMQARPMPMGEADLAGRAMRLALSGRFVSSAAVNAPRVKRVRMFSSMLATAASLLVVGVIALAGYLAMNSTSSTETSATGTETTANAAASSGTSSNSSSGTDWSAYIAGGIVLAAAGILWGSRGQVVVAGPARA